MEKLLVQNVELADAIDAGLQEITEARWHFLGFDDLGSGKTLCGCPLGAAAVAKLGAETARHEVRQIELRAGSVVRHMAALLGIDEDLAAQISTQHYMERKTARDIADELRAGTFEYAD